MPYDVTRLKNLQTSLNDLQANPSAGGTHAFMAEFLDFYLGSLEDPSLLEAAGAQTVFAAAAEVLPWVDLYYVGGLESFLQSSWEGPEWLTACRRRTAIEGLNEQLIPRFGGDARVDTEDVDELIRGRAETEAFVPPGERPANLPSSHWWWDL